MSWRYRNKETRRRSVWRWLVWSLLIFLAIAALATLIFWSRLSAHYDQIAAGYDLSNLKEMESASVILDRSGVELGKIFVRNRDAIPLTEMPFHLVQAVVAAEDNRFFQHKGVDYLGMLRAAIKNWRAGRITQGASTLTQQLARNTFALQEKSYERKLVEVFLARRIEKAISKREILELYLNRVYFGSGFYGVEAAAQGYFGKSASNLTVPESAMLAGLLKSPNNLSPWSDRAAAEREAAFVMGRMRELGMLDETAFRKATSAELPVKNRRSLNYQSYAIDYIRQQVIADIGYENAVSDGYRIYTTIDSKLQNLAEKQLAARLEAIEHTDGYTHQTYDEYSKIFEGFQRNKDKMVDADGKQRQPPLPEYIQGALLAIENHSGAILAMVGGRDFSHSEYNRAILAKRPAGTAFLPIVYGAAYEKGFSPGYLVDDSPLNNRQVMIGGTQGVLGEWGPERVLNRYEGPIPAREALIQSKNAASVRLGLRTGLETLSDFARGLGIQSPLRPFPATFLGSSEVSLLEMTRAISAIPQSGVYAAEPFVITKITERNGKEVFTNTANLKRGMTPDVAYQLHDALSASLETGTADKATLQFGLKRFDGGGKTGTAYDFTDLWFLGYNSAITCGVWIGFDKPRTIFRGAFSSDIALPVWVDFMNASLENYPPIPIERPDSLRMIELDAKTGLPPGSQQDSQLAPEAKPKTFSALVTPKQLQLLSGNGLNELESTTKAGQWPRAQIATDLDQLRPVPVMAPTVVDTVDPYSAITKTIMKAEAVNGASSSETSEVRRAEVVRPFDQPLEAPSVKLAPPKPLTF